MDMNGKAIETNEQKILRTLRAWDRPDPPSLRTLAEVADVREGSVPGTLARLRKEGKVAGYKALPTGPAGQVPTKPAPPPPAKAPVKKAKKAPAKRAAKKAAAKAPVRKGVVRDAVNTLLRDAAGVLNPATMPTLAETIASLERLAAYHRAEAKKRQHHDAEALRYEEAIRALKDEGRASS